MAKVGIVMGSDSDLPVMSKAAQMLEKFGIDYEITIISAHRMPDVFLTMLLKLRRRELSASSRVQEERLIFRECVRLYSRFLLSVFQSIRKLLEVWILSILSFRCQVVFRLQRLQ